MNRMMMNDQQEDADRARREKEEFEKECISKALKLKKESGCVCYDPHRSTGLFVCESRPTDLCGDYDVIFQYSHYDYGARYEKRTTRGKLVLREEDGLLRGRVDIDEDIPPGEASHYNANFNFDEQKEDNRFVLSGFDPHVEFCVRLISGAEEIAATLDVIEERCGLPWLLSEEDSCKHDCTPFKFDTLEEAELVAKKATDHSDSWLCNHLGVDAFVAKNIHEFVAWKPDPVLFLEPGDLFLDVVWSVDHGEAAGSWLIARKTS
jgi:hypothetical protein